MGCVGSSVAVSQALVDAPLFTVQAARYALVAVVLLILSVAACRRRRGLSAVATSSCDVR